MLCCLNLRFTLHYLTIYQKPKVKQARHFRPVRSVLVGRLLPFHFQKFLSSKNRHCFHRAMAMRTRPTQKVKIGQIHNTRMRGDTRWSGKSKHIRPPLFLTFIAGAPSPYGSGRRDRM